MCESNLSYLMAYLFFLVLSICHWVNQDLWASSQLQILIMVLQIEGDTQVLKEGFVYIPTNPRQFKS